MTVNLSLPRALAKVAVRLLDSDDYVRTDWVADPVPEIDCYPYIRSRDAGGSHVCDTAIEEEDLYIRDPDPSSDAVQGLNTSPSRWIEMSFPNRTSASDEIGWAWQDDTDTGPSLQIDTCTIMSKRMLGNVVAPVYANFVERNLAPPVQTSGLVRTIRNGQVVSTSQISSLARQGQKIFDGFKDNPGDYDDDTTVEFTYRFEDKFGAVAQGQVSFHGRSIISCRQRLFSISYEQAPADPMNRPVRFDSPDILRLEAIARDLIEREIVDFAIEVKRSSSSGRPLFPPGREPEPIDPVALTKRLRSDRRLLQHVDRSFKTVWRDPALWGASWKTQSRILKQVVQDRRALLDEPKTGDLMLAASQLREEEQQEFDSVIISMFAQRTMGRLRRDQTVIDRLRSL